MIKPITLEPVFMPLTADTGKLRSKIKKAKTSADVLKALDGVPFDEAYDFLRALAIESVKKEEIDRAITTFIEFDVELTNSIEPDEGEKLNVHAAVKQILTALYLQADRLAEASATAAETLQLLAQQPRRKDSPFLQVLGSLLYDISYLHSSNKEFKQAERETEKSIKIFERLAKTDAERYASPHVMALNNATSTYRNRVKQAELLAHFQEATSAYTEMVNAGAEDATGRLVESLTAEGDTLAKMGRVREAVQYYSRALKYLTKIEPEFTMHQLRLSIALGETMLSIDAMRDKGVHLLNTMLHKATKINALDEHRRIVDALVNAKSRNRDILSFWHKIFPR